MVFPILEGVDLEYRAKLAELCKAKETIYGRIRHFVENAKYDKKHLHQFAEYCLIRDLSKILFNQDFVSDMKKWEAISYEKINEASIELLKRNTKQLESAGAESVTDAYHFILKGLYYGKIQKYYNDLFVGRWLVCAKTIICL